MNNSNTISAYKQTIERYTLGKNSVDVNEVLPGVFMLNYHFINIDRHSFDLVNTEILKSRLEVNKTIN